MKLTRRGFLQAAAVAPAAAALAQLKPGEQGRVLVPPRVLAGEAVSKGPISVGLFTGNHEITGDGYSRAGVEFNPASRGSIDNANDYLAGLGIILPDTTSDPTSSSITLKVRDGWQWVEFAPDVAGSPGTYATGDEVLGDIAAADHEFFWARIEGY